jgi:hypothetical protein
MPSYHGLWDLTYPGMQGDNKRYIWKYFVLYNVSIDFNFRFPKKVIDTIVGHDTVGDPHDNIYIYIYISHNPVLYINIRIFVIRPRL